MVIEILLSIAILSASDESAQAGVESRAFYEGAKAQFDVEQQLYWSFQIEGVAEARVAHLLAALSKAGFIEADVDEGLTEGSFTVHVSEVKAHSGDTFGDRVQQIDRLAREHGGKLEDYAVGPAGAL